MTERTEEEILSGLLLVSLGGLPRSLPVRPAETSRAWKRELVAAVAGGIGPMSMETLADTGDIASAFGDRVLDLVVSYDDTGALGGREWLGKHATDEQLYALFRRLLSVTFPFVRDLRTALVELRAFGLADLLATSVGSLRERSTSGSSESSPPVVPPDSIAS